MAIDRSEFHELAVLALALKWVVPASMKNYGAFQRRNTARLAYSATWQSNMTLGKSIKLALMTSSVLTRVNTKEALPSMTRN